MNFQTGLRAKLVRSWVPTSAIVVTHWLATKLQENTFSSNGSQPRSREKVNHLVTLVDLESFLEKYETFTCLHTTSPYGTVVAPPSLASSQHSPTPLELCELVVPPKRRHPKIYASGLDQQGLPLVQQMIRAIVQLPPWSISRGRKDNEKGRRRTKHEKTKRRKTKRELYDTEYCQFCCPFSIL